MIAFVNVLDFSNFKIGSLTVNNICPLISKMEALKYCTEIKLKYFIIVLQKQKKIIIKNSMKMSLEIVQVTFTRIQDLEGMQKIYIEEYKAKKKQESS